jgi:hypothetical protein
MLEWSLVSDATMQMDCLSAMPPNNANTLVAISLVMLAAVQLFMYATMYMWREVFYSYELLQ